MALPEQLRLVSAGVAAQHSVLVDVVRVVGAARHMVRRHQHLIKILRGSVLQWLALLGLGFGQDRCRPSCA